MIELPPGVKREPLSKGNSYPSPARWAVRELEHAVKNVLTRLAEAALL